jgi:hypothetical protein
LPWSEVHVADDVVVARLDHSDFEQLEKLQRDQWPGR